MNHRINNVLARRATFPRHLYDQNCVFGRERDEQNEPDLHIDIVRQSNTQQRRHGAK